MCATLLILMIRFLTFDVAQLSITSDNFVKVVNCNFTGQL